MTTEEKQAMRAIIYAISHTSETTALRLVLKVMEGKALALEAMEIDDGPRYADRVEELRALVREWEVSDWGEQ